ncbi:MAG: sugar isomerase [Anaerolineae bacterium]
MSLQVKPVLVYEIYQKQSMTSWRSWGGIQTEENVKDEEQRIKKELQILSAQLDFPLELLPLASVRDKKDVAALREELGATDVTLIYAAGGSHELLRAVMESSNWNLVFLRHRSGPIYLWYEIIHPMVLRQYSDKINNPKLDIDDIVVDSYDELQWRLRALSGLKATSDTSVLALGGLSAWGMWSAPEIKTAALAMTRDKFKIDVTTVSYPEFANRLEKARNDTQRVRQAHQMAENYLLDDTVTLQTTRESVDNAFLVYLVFKDLMRESGAAAITILDCMSTIIPIAKTTACLPLSLINDEGNLAFCESDFVVIPSGILLHNISRKPTFLNDPTYPHDGIITLAHCTAPRRMNGKDFEPTRIVTHYESDYGAAPKVQFKEGQDVTVIVPDFKGESWVGFKGEIVESPFYPICRSQAKVRIKGDWRALLTKMRGFHFMMGYGDYTKELGYALKKAGIAWTLV